MLGPGHTFLSRVVTAAHRSALTGTPDTRCITCHHHNKEPIYRVLNPPVLWRTNTGYRVFNKYAVWPSPISVRWWLSSASLLTDWVPLSAPRLRVNGPGPGGTQCQEQGSSRWNVVAGKSINLFFYGSEQREADMSQLELYVKFYIGWKLELLKFTFNTFLWSFRVVKVVSFLSLKL